MKPRGGLPDLQAFRVSCEACSLAELCLPRALDHHELARLDEVLERPKGLRRGETLFRSGERAQALYAVRAGSFKTSQSTSDGDEQVFGFHVAGELVGLDGMGRERHSCSATALEDASVCVLPMDDLERLCREFPGLQHHIITMVGDEVADDHALLMLLGKAHAQERLAALLVSLSKRFEARGFSGTEFNLSMSRQDIASYLGLAVETVSREFRRLHDAGLVDIDRRFVQIRDLDRLRALTEHCMGRGPTP